MIDVKEIQEYLDKHTHSVEAKIKNGEYVFINACTNAVIFKTAKIESLEAWLLGFKSGKYLGKS